MEKRLINKVNEPTYKKNLYRKETYTKYTQRRNIYRNKTYMLHNMKKGIILEMNIIKKKTYI